MADQVNVTGRVIVKVQFTAGQGNLLTLGEQMDMTDVERRAFWHNVPGDRHGGPQGPPIEVQYLGEIAIIRIELSRWDPDVWDTLQKRKAIATKGKTLLTEVGTLMLASTPIRLLLHSTTRPENYPCCILREAIQYGMGTKFSTAVAQFEAHRMPATGWAAEGVLQDAVTTEYAS